MTESSSLTTLVPPSFLTDASGVVWSIVPASATNMQVSRNGTAQTSTSNVSLLLYFNHAVYYQNTSNAWFAWKSNAWAKSADPRKPVLTESAAGTSVTTVGPAIVDATLESFTLIKSATTSLGLQIAVNGVVDGTTNNVILLYYTNHRIYQENSGLGWWYKTKSTDTWTSTTDPRTSTTVTPPTNVVASQVTASSITLSWTASQGP